MLDFIMSTNAMTRTTIGFFFITELVVLDVEGLTYAVSAGSDSAMQAGAIVPIFIIIATLFSGFFIGVTEIPAWLAWIKYISFVFYGFSALAQNEFDGQIIIFASVIQQILPVQLLQERKFLIFMD